VAREPDVDATFRSDSSTDRRRRALLCDDGGREVPVTVRRPYLVAPLITATALLVVSGASARQDADVGPRMSPDAALQRLVDGNRRFQSGTPKAANLTPTRRTEVAKVQRPFAGILGCSDSRVPPEVVFDSDLGDLFVVRVAGNAADAAALASFEYAVVHLGVNLIAVVGHERCGAVAAAIAAATAGPDKPLDGHMPNLVGPLLPAVSRVPARAPDRVDQVCWQNVTLVVDALRSSAPILAPRVQSGTLKIVGGRYDLDTGTVVFNK
jgi:carbonic anhydrase